MENRALRHRWQIFADHLLSGLSATDAYIAAGYRCATRPSAQAASSRLHHRPEVQAYTRHLTNLASLLSRQNTLNHLRSQLAPFKIPSKTQIPSSKLINS